MDKKFELTEWTMEYEGRVLHRIRALKTFGFITKGEFGGWVEKEENLAQFGQSWISGNAMVFDDAYINGDARITENAKVYGHAEVWWHAVVYGCAQVFDYANVADMSSVSGNAQVYGSAFIFGDSQVDGNAQIYDNAAVLGSARVLDNARIYGTTNVCSDAIIRSDSIVGSSKDYVVVGPIGPDEVIITFARLKNGIGVFKKDCNEITTIDDLEQKMKTVCSQADYAQEYLDAIEYVRKKLSRR